MVSRMVSVAVVTGGNKGIGLSIVKKSWFSFLLHKQTRYRIFIGHSLCTHRVTKHKLLQSDKFTHVYLTSRNVELGTEAISRKDFISMISITIEKYELQ